MQITRKHLIGTLAATSLIAGAAVPVVAQSDDSRSAKSFGSLLQRGSDSLSVRGLTADSRLIAFNERTPALARTLGRISGLAGDTKLIGIDYRPATGDLYGVGEQGGVYTLDSRARATKRAQLTVALGGTSFGIDFNPAVDRLRIVSDTGQSLRADVSTGATTTDVVLSYPPATTAATGVTGSAYTNNDADPNTSTTLFALGTAMDQVAIQSPANSGRLTATGTLGADASAPSGFDIYNTVRRDTTIDVSAAAALTVGGRSRFYAVDATARGT